MLENVNATGKTFLSHTMLDGKEVIRLATGGTFTELDNIKRAYEIIVQEHDKLINLQPLK